MKKSVNMKDVLCSFSGKRVFITGHTGFKGSWMTFLLSTLGAEVMGYAQPPNSENSHFNMLGLDDKIRHVVGDICNVETLDDAMQSFQPEYVFHLAAQALVRVAYDDPVTTLRTNIMGSTNILDAVRRCQSVRSLVYVTSDKCYENSEWVWGYRETDQLGGHDPYSASKAAAEIVFSAYNRSFFSSRSDIGTATVRAGNVIGGGDWAQDRIVPDCVRAAKDGSILTLRNAMATRPWQHVLEPLSGYLLVSSHLYDSANFAKGAWNFGPSTTDVLKVSEVAQRILDFLGRGSVEIGLSDNKQHEANLLQLNCDKAHQILEWRPRWDVNQTLIKTAEWYKAWIDGEEMEAVTRGQIYEYFDELQ